MQRQQAMRVVVLGLALLAASSLPAQTWRALGPSGGDVRSLTPDPQNPALLYLGTSDGHVFLSRDGAEHWQLLSRVGTRQDTVVMAILVDAQDSRRLYAATWTLAPGGGGVFRSEDGGRTWQAAGLAGQTVRALAQAPSQPELLVAGTLEGVFRSADKGKHWERISPAGHDDLRNFDSVAIDPQNPDIIYAGTYHLAWKTTDGGRNWAPIHKGMIDDSDVMHIVVDRVNAERIYATACSGMYRSENRGELWTKIRGIPASARRTHFLRQDSLRPEVLYAGTTEGLWKSTDGSLTWKRITAADWSISGLVIHPQKPQRLVLGTERRGVFVSGDGGQTFHAANQGFEHQQVVAFATDPQGPDHLLVVVTNAVHPVLVTHDAGHTWVPIGAGLRTEALLRVYGAPGGWWAALATGGLMRFDEQKGSWIRAGVMEAPKPAQKFAPAKKGAAAKRITPVAPKPPRPLTAVVYDMAFSRELLLAATQEGLLASRDRGTTWFEFEVATQKRLPVYSARVSGDGRQLWVISQHALFQSVDAGKTWARQPLPVDADRSTRLHVVARDASDATLLVAGHRGLYVSRDTGESWRQANLPELVISDVAVAADAVVAATRSGLFVSADRGDTWTRLEDAEDGAHFPLVARMGVTENVVAASSTESLRVIGVAAVRAATNPAAPIGVARGTESPGNPKQ